MPKFVFKKLIRDKLRDEYEKMNQMAVYRQLSKTEHGKELIRKIIEETSEIPLDESKEAIAGEIADVQQAIDDLIALQGVSVAEVTAIKEAKFGKKGGFSGGNFVETLELQDGDEWVEYYRARPDIFKEIT